MRLAASQVEYIRMYMQVAIHATSFFFLLDPWKLCRDRKEISFTKLYEEKKRSSHPIHSYVVASSISWWDTLASLHLYTDCFPSCVSTSLEIDQTISSSFSLLGIHKSFSFLFASFAQTRYFRKKKRFSILFCWVDPPLSFCLSWHHSFQS